MRVSWAALIPWLFIPGPRLRGHSDLAVALLLIMTEQQKSKWKHTKLSRPRSGIGTWPFYPHNCGQNKSHGQVQGVGKVIPQWQGYTHKGRRTGLMVQSTVPWATPIGIDFWGP